MAHFAKIENGMVTEVLVADQDFIDALPTEGGAFWLQTSYNTFGGIHYDPNTGLPSDEQHKAARKNYAGIGMIYDANLDAFYDPQPFASWSLNTDTCLWEAPVPRPDDINMYNWDEDTLSWIRYDPVE